MFTRPLESSPLEKLNLGIMFTKHGARPLESSPLEKLNLGIMFTKHGAINIVDPGNMQDVCHI